MRSVLAGLRNLVLPWGATTGRRIILAGDTASITLWDGTTIVGEITATGSQFDIAIRLAVAGDTDARWYVRPDGAMFWGPGNIGADTMIERTAPAELHTPGSLVIDDGLTVSGDVIQRPAGRQARMLVDAANLAASGDLSPLPTVATPVPGCVLALTTDLPAGQVKVRGTFDFHCQVFSAGVICLGFLYVDGVPATAQATFEASASVCLDESLIT